MAKRETVETARVEKASGVSRAKSRIDRNSTMVVYQQLRSAILRGELTPDSHLSQVQIARRYNVSRGPLREAVRMLQQEGFVNVEVNQRARVAAFSVQDLEQLYAMRIVVEAFAVRASVPSFTDVDLTTISAFLDGMERTSSSEIAAWRKMHRGFHFSIIARAGDRVVATIKQLYDHCDRYRTIYAFPESYSWLMVPAEHHAIAEACRKRDPGLASRTLAIHLSRTALTMLMMVAPHYDPAAVRSALQLVTGEAGIESTLVGKRVAPTNS
jgi:DNA-binding GntR family transcriptional regulator